MNNAVIINKLKGIHGNDLEQLAFVLCEDKRIIVTAPAGCGKTKSMVSKIVYEIVNSKGSNLKRILALTFSVNTAIKIKDDTSEILPSLLDKNCYNLNRKLDISNYHGFAKKLIKQHGYILNENLKEVDDFEIIVEDIKGLSPYCISSEINFIKMFKQSLINAEYDKIDGKLDEYFNLVINKLVSKNFITYDAMIVIAIKLLENKTIRNFYSKYYQMIIIDEFQDTNYLSYILVTKLIGDANSVILMGDDIQKIYNFIGAMPDVFVKANEEFDMTKFEFMTNYRFKDNESMKNLDRYLRSIFRNYDILSNKYSESACLNFGFYKNAKQEATTIVNMIKKNKVDELTSAVLVRAAWLVENVRQELNKRKISYFYGLFSDNDPQYRVFHDYTLNYFIEESGSSKSVSKRIFENVKNRLKHNKGNIVKDKIIFDSLMRLLEALFLSVSKKLISRQDKYLQIHFNLSNYSLKRFMNEIDETVFLTTIHGSKGLEWDYIYIPEIMDYQFPTSRGLCKDCTYRRAGIKNEHKCIFKFPSDLKKPFLEELSLFYVAITRARINVFAFANIEKKNGINKRRSCLANLPNLQLIKEKDFKKVT